MKYLKIGLVMIAAAVSAQTAAQEVPTTIEQVTVYRQGAQVFRHGEVAVSNGKSELKVTGLSPFIDERSIQVTGTGGNVTITGVKHTLNYLDKPGKTEQISLLEGRIKSTEEQINRLNYRHEVLLAKLSLLKSNQTIGGTNGTTVADLGQAVEFFDAALTDIKNEQMDVLYQLGTLTEQQEDLKKQLDQITGTASDPTGEITVMVEADQAARMALRISYSVANARWFPMYDIRVHSVNEPMQITYKAGVAQQTGEDWNNVRLKLSDSNPNKSGTAPTLSPWWLYTHEPNVMHDSMTLEKALSGKAPGIYGSRAMDAEVMEETSVGYISATIIEKLTSVEFEVDRPYSVLSNRESTEVELNRHEVTAGYEYYAVPKLDRDVFLMARIFGWSRFNFLDGEASLYFEDTYVGRSFLNTRAVTDTLSISLGRDPGIVVSREKVDTYESKRLIGSNQVASRGFELVVRNNKSQNVSLKLYDQFPVSSMNDISVKHTETTGGTVSAQTGVIYWEMEVGSGQQQSRTLAYEVKYPKNAIVVLE